MEKTVGDLSGRIVRVESQIEALTNDVRSLAKSVGAMADAMSNSHRTNWGVIFTGVGSMIAVIVLYVAPFVSEQTELKEAGKLQRAAYVAHIGDGHATRIIRLENEFSEMQREQRERMRRAAAYIDQLSWEAVTTRRN